MKPDNALQQAEDCRMMAGLLLAFAIVAAFAGGCVWYSLGPGFMLLACVTVAVVCGLGFVNESKDARRLDRRARSSQPVNYENFGHE